MDVDKRDQDDKQLTAAVSAFNEPGTGKVVTVNCADSIDTVMHVIFKNGVLQTTFEGSGSVTVETMPDTVAGRS